MKRHNLGLKTFYFYCNLLNNFTLRLTHKTKADIPARILDTRLLVSRKRKDLGDKITVAIQIF